MRRHLLWVFLLACALRVQHVGGPLRWEERDLVPGLRDISLCPLALYVPPKVGDHTPLAVVAAAPLYHLSPHTAWVLRIPSLLAGSLIPVVLAWALSRAMTPTAGLMAGLLAASNNFLVTWSAYFMQEMLFLLFAAAGLITMACAERRRSTPLALLSALLCAISFWTHEFALLLVPLAGLYLLTSSRSRGWLRTPGPWISLLLWGALVLPYFAWNFAQRDRFSAFGGMSIAQQHMAATILARRALNARFFTFFVGGGLNDLVRGWPRFELNHVEPLAGACLLLAAACLVRKWRDPAIRLCLLVFWGVLILFSLIDLEFRIYRFSLSLLPGCALAGIVLARAWQAKGLLRCGAAVLVGYCLFTGVSARPYAAGAAHQGFRWWGKGPLFSERPLIELVRRAQQASPASLVIMPAPFWDHAPLQAEYEAGVRCVGGSRETIYSSTFWIRPYGPSEAGSPRIVLSCQEDVASWGEFLRQAGYDTALTRHDTSFRGIMQDTAVACPLYVIDAASEAPVPVETFLDRIYRP